MQVMVLDTCTLVGGCWIEPGPVVGRFETQYVILLRQRHWHVRLVAGMFGGVLERLAAAEGDGGLEPGGYRRLPSQSSLGGIAARYTASRRAAGRPSFASSCG
jgi:hypothetical protein